MAGAPEGNRGRRHMSRAGRAARLGTCPFLTQGSPRTTKKPTPLTPTPLSLRSLPENFYRRGLSSTADPLFDSSFINVYTQADLQGVPWHAVLGNHVSRSERTAQRSAAQHGMKVVADTWGPAPAAALQLWALAHSRAAGTTRAACCTHGRAGALALLIWRCLLPACRCRTTMRGRCVPCVASAPTTRHVLWAGGRVGGT